MVNVLSLFSEILRVSGCINNSINSPILQLNSKLPCAFEATVATLQVETCLVVDATFILIKTVSSKVATFILRLYLIS